MKTWLLLALAVAICRADGEDDPFGLEMNDEHASEDTEEIELTSIEQDLENLEENSESIRVFADPCRDLKCSAGRECTINEETGEGKCSCVADCGQEEDPRRKVCSNHNETYATDCDLHQARCLCEENSDLCKGSPDKYTHMHVEYYGECRNIADCTAEELEDFPRRMREWLFNVMKELAERKELSFYYQDLEKEAETDQTKRWRNAALWKWCDLDGQPHDNAISRHELFPVKAPLQALEHCIGDFLDGCDTDNDHAITLSEWGACLNIGEEELEAKCEKLNQED